MSEPWAEDIARTLPDDLYLIWSIEHDGWWAPGMQGYTRRLSEAGRYRRGDALRICANAMFGSRRTLNEVPVRLTDVDMMVQRFTGTVGRAPDPATEPWA